MRRARVPGHGRCAGTVRLGRSRIGGSGRARRRPRETLIYACARSRRACAERQRRHAELPVRHLAYPERVREARQPRGGGLGHRRRGPLVGRFVRLGVEHVQLGIRKAGKEARWQDVACSPSSACYSFGKTRHASSRRAILATIRSSWRSRSPMLSYMLLA